MSDYVARLNERRFEKNGARNSYAKFQKMVLEFYKDHGRKLPWRETANPYHILVSEIMLQQTQVHRVIDKYIQFITEIPDFNALASISIQHLLQLWQGLGYNRRALSLKDIAECVVRDYHAKLPTQPEALESFKGIGPNTAASICVFAFNMPLVFIETNIRRVYTHFFFNDEDTIDDRDLKPVIEATLYMPSPRDWYNALMDLGSLIPKHTENPNRRNKAYRKQSPFEGSQRQIRGEVLRSLSQRPLSWKGLKKSTDVLVKTEPDYIKKAVSALESEGFITMEDGVYRIKETT